MHVPDFKKAVMELCRVLKPGGRIVISERNMCSVEGVLTRIATKPSEKLSIRRVPFGIEYWIDTPSGTLLARMANIAYLIEFLRQNGVVVDKRYAGQFTELYTHLSRWPTAQKATHLWNEFWFRFVRLPGLAMGNILLGHKVQS